MEEDVCGVGVWFSMSEYLEVAGVAFMTAVSDYQSSTHYLSFLALRLGLSS